MTACWPTRTVKTRVETGRLLGRLHGSGVASFRGIPYAAPPTGPRRWAPPDPASAWHGPRPAFEIGPAPLQPQPPTNQLMWHANFADRRALVMSEDCLYLNVWTPDVSGSGLPVLVFLQGGGNRLGHGGQEIHDGASMAGRGVIVVTLSMRLGALGFLAHPELGAENDLGSSGNYGVLDVVAALRWVQRNIASFGGDPGRVTLGGNSAGAALVNHLMAAPAARGLFQAALGQSAAGMGRAEGRTPTIEEAEEHGLAALGAMAGLPLAQLRRMPATTFLLDAPLGIVVDGRAVVEETEDVFNRGGQARIPLLAGWNVDEGANFTPFAALDQLRTRVQQGPYAAQLRPFYPVDDANLQRSARTFSGDTRFAGPVWHWACTHVRTSAAPTWVYQFDQAPPLPTDIDLVPPPDGGAEYGSFHTAELPYTGDNLGCRPWPWRDSDRRLATAAADAWGRFVTDHDPGHLADLSWPRFDGTHQGDTLVLGGPVRVEPVHRVEALSTVVSLPRPL
ncbi:MAG: carboxylesterase family protein [Nocardioidaceae bacterium]